jgi:hypothetical protein
MRKAILLFLSMTMAAALCAQQQKSAAPASKGQATAPAKKTAAHVPAGAPTREDVMKLFELLQVGKTMEFAIQTAKQQSREMADQLIQDKAPDATPAQKKQIQDMVNEVMDQALGPAAIQEMLEATVPVYQRHLTKADVKAMVDFYSSQVGRKILREQPAMVQESMQAASGIQQRIARTAFQKIDERMGEIVREQEK